MIPSLLLGGCLPRCPRRGLVIGTLANRLTAQCVFIHPIILFYVLVRKRSTARPGWICFRHRFRIELPHLTDRELTTLNLIVHGSFVPVLSSTCPSWATRAHIYGRMEILDSGSTSHTRMEVFFTFTCSSSHHQYTTMNISAYSFITSSISLFLIY